MLDVEAVKLQWSRRWLIPNHKCEEFIAHSFWLFIADTFFSPETHLHFSGVGCLFSLPRLFFSFFLPFASFFFSSCFGQNNLRYARSHGAMFPFPMVSRFLRECGQAFRGPTLFGTRNSQVVFERAIYATGNVNRVNRSNPVVDLNLFLHKLGILSGQIIVTSLWPHWNHGWEKLSPTWALFQWNIIIYRTQICGLMSPSTGQWGKMWRPEPPGENTKKDQTIYGSIGTPCNPHETHTEHQEWGLETDFPQKERFLCSMWVFRDVFHQEKIGTWPSNILAGSYSDTIAITDM